MKVEDGTNFHAYTQAVQIAIHQRGNKACVLTHTTHVMHDIHGYCMMKIYRSIPNDSLCNIEKARRWIALHEPKVGWWEGDRIEYWKNETCVEVKE